MTLRVSRKASRIRIGPTRRYLKKVSLSLDLFSDRKYKSIPKRLALLQLWATWPILFEERANSTVDRQKSKGFDDYSFRVSASSCVDFIHKSRFSRRVRNRRTHGASVSRNEKSAYPRAGDNTLGQLEFGK